MKTLWLSIYCLGCVAVLAQTTPSTSDSKAALLERVNRGEYSAMLEAGRAGDTNIIPYLEGQITGNPTDPSTEAAAMALAKLGVKKYLDEAIAELTATNSALFEAHMKNGGCPFPSAERRKQCATMETQETAFKKLAYIRNPSTVKVVAQFLYSTEHYQFAHDVPPWWPSSAAIFTLRQMVDNPPQSDDAKVWQQWWELNKHKYP
jgi:hypothetical protein